MSKLFGESHRRLQREFDTERLANRIEERLFREHIAPDDRAFIERMDMFFLATTDSAGCPNCSYKGGDPGFVRVLDPQSLVFPNYDGNGMFISMGNTLENPHVGLLFIDFENPKRLRLNGIARIEPAVSIKPPYPEAQFVVRVQVRQVFPNCPRYIHKMQLVERSKFVPHATVTTPVPAWKRMEWACDVLPASDPERYSQMSELEGNVESGRYARVLRRKLPARLFGPPKTAASPFRAGRNCASVATR